MPARLLALSLLLAMASCVKLEGNPVSLPEVYAAPSLKCMWVGSPSRDVVFGSSLDEVLCSKRGNDYVNGQRGDDVIRAGKGSDVLVGEVGRDTLYGQQGRDRLFAADDTSGEQVFGGRGFDRCFVDRGDHASGCEKVFEAEPSMARRLANALLEEWRGGD